MTLGRRREMGAAGGGRAPVSGGALLLLGLSVACGPGEPIDPPRLLYGSDPVEYPLDLWDRELEGRTVVRARVTDRGAVDSVEIAESSGHPAFDSAALEGVREFHFAPARQGKERIVAWVRVPVEFSRRPDEGGGLIDPGGGG